MTAAARPRLGWADSAALTITFFSLGVTLQVLLIDRGASLLNALTASTVIWSATSQFAYLAVRDAGGGEWAAIVPAPSSRPGSGSSRRVSYRACRRGPSAGRSRR